MKRRLGASTDENQKVKVVLKRSPWVRHGGFRIVLPYEYVYKTFVKQRWFSRKVHEVLLTEFAALDDEYIKRAASEGKIRVETRNEGRLYEDNPVAVLDHVLKQNHCLIHNVVLHEQLALDTPVAILKDTKDYILASKPCGIPVYNTGTYHYNTLVEWLKADLEPKNQELYPLFRIDKPVAGVVALAKNGSTASRFNVDLKGGLVKKVYIARVKGNFLKCIADHDDFIVVDREAGEYGKVINSRGYMRPISIKLAKHEFLANCDYLNCKEAFTRYRMVAYNSDTDESLILCSPITGRTHQIRAHLKFLGYPISNDGHYNDNPVDSSKYFTKIPIVKWQLDEHKRWCLPQIGFKHDECTELEHHGFHVGLNRPELQGDGIQSGIFLHAFRYIWPGEFDVSDAVPPWALDFGQLPHLEGMDLWPKESAQSQK